jgi:hypothetical protein
MHVPLTDQLGKKPDQEFLANGASPHLHLERQLAYAPELNPGEGLWQQPEGSSYPMCAVLTSHICVMSCATR